MKQVWFPGVHCDVGGGYAEEESGLSKIALQWMIGEAREALLLVEDEKVETILGRRGRGYVRPDPNACLELMTGMWRSAEYLPKPHWNDTTKTMEWRANHYRRRRFPERPCVHDAAWERAGGYAAAHLPADAVQLSPIKRTQAAANGLMVEPAAAPAREA